jgi:hypothetical protein
MKGFVMTSIFPKLPNGLTTSELRKEIRKRIKMMDEMGLIKR